MNDYLSRVNAGSFYLMVAGILGFITVLCFVFLVKSYRAGLEIGMDKKVLKKTITASATFTLLPSVSILLGVIALSGSLGVPYTMTGGTDSKFYKDICENAIRFAPIYIDAQQYSSIHGVDDNIYQGALPKAVDFYKAVIKKC